LTAPFLTSFPHVTIENECLTPEQFVGSLWISQSISIPVVSNNIIEFDPHSLLIKPQLDCLFIIGFGLQMMEESKVLVNFKEFECPEKADCPAGLHEFR